MVFPCLLTFVKFTWEECHAQRVHANLFKLDPPMVSLAEIRMKYSFKSLKGLRISDFYSEDVKRFFEIKAFLKSSGSWYIAEYRYKRRLTHAR
jgi:hypothetical protein